MIQERIDIQGKKVDGYVIPLGDVNLVFVVTEHGLAGCGAFDVQALDTVAYPAVKIKAKGKPRIITLQDLLDGQVKEANTSAQKRGIVLDMPTQEAIVRLM